MKRMTDDAPVGVVTNGLTLGDTSVCTNCGEPIVVRGYLGSLRLTDYHWSHLGGDLFRACNLFATPIETPAVVEEPEEKPLAPINLNAGSWFDRYVEAYLEENFERFAENWQAKRARDDRWQERQDFLNQFHENEGVGFVVTWGGPGKHYRGGVEIPVEPEWYQGRSYKKVWSDMHNRVIWVEVTEEV
jgi:hypothetical protein